MTRCTCTVSSARGMTTRRGFALVELLVAIGTIALLMSIVVPAVSKARDATDRVARTTGLVNSDPVDQRWDDSGRLYHCPRPYAHGSGDEADQPHAAFTVGPGRTAMLHPSLLESDRRAVQSSAAPGYGRQSMRCSSSVDDSNFLIVDCISPYHNDDGRKPAQIEVGLRHHEGARWQR
jgi:hypothetical protein